MTDEHKRTAIQTLFDIEQRCRENARELPRQIEIREDWLGIGFRVGQTRLVAPLGDVIEILTYPGMSKVPGSKEWVRGIANVRGNLLPIMDLQRFLGGSGTVPCRRSRVLVVNHKGVFSGLIVDEVLGLKHLSPEARTLDIPDIDATLAGYVVEGFWAGDDFWGVFSMRQLAEAPQFLKAAI